MSKVKVFRIIGNIVKPNFQTTFQKEVRALKPEGAIDRIYTEIGSKHKAKRYQIKIHKVIEINPSEIEDPVIKRLTLGENT